MMRPIRLFTLSVFAITTVLLLSPTTVAESPQPPPTIGAIRWDGWFRDNPWEKNLAPAQWRYRLPFYATTSNDGVQVCGDTQETVDREIAHAKAGGIAYWAFCYYHPKSWPQADAYNYGWRRYLASAHKKDINFCFILQGGSHLGPPGEWSATVDELVSRFKEPTYQRVCGNRPLLYVFACEKLIPHFGSIQAAGDAFRQLREASKKAGLADPYIAAQIWPSQLHADFLDAVHFDALSAYSAQGSTGEGEPYSRLVVSNQWYWAQYKTSGREIIPTVNAGWDGRPRKYTGPWYEDAAPSEVANAIGQALDWVQANLKTVPARSVLVYAWNEHDEGGWLCPTLKEGTARLDAIRNMLNARRPR